MTGSSHDFTGPDSNKCQCFVESMTCSNGPGFGGRFPSGTLFDIEARTTARLASPTTTTTRKTMTVFERMDIYLCLHSALRVLRGPLSCDQERDFERQGQEIKNQEPEQEPHVRERRRPAIQGQSDGE